MKHVVCYSGGHSSALAAIEVARRYLDHDGESGHELVLLNHDIHASVEDADVKRFKREVAEYLGLPVTYANHPNVETMDQFDIVMEKGGFKFSNGVVQCTRLLKTDPFNAWLEANVHDKSSTLIYYGFDRGELHRIQRRSSIMGSQGYRTAYPLALWPRTILSTREIGIEPPLTYSVWKHANCTGCLKGGRQHWYVVYCTRPDVFAKAKATEEAIGYSILPDIELAEIEPMFAAMKAAGVEATEHVEQRKFWIAAKKRLAVVREVADEPDVPCECVV